MIEFKLINLYSTELWKCLYSHWNCIFRSRTSYKKIFSGLLKCTKTKWLVKFSVQMIQKCPHNMQLNSTKSSNLFPRIFNQKSWNFQHSVFYHRHTRYNYKIWKKCNDELSTASEPKMSSFGTPPVS